MVSNEELATMILRYRVEHSLTQKQLAKISNVSFTTLNQIEGLKRVPTASTKMKLILFMEKNP